jgi:hypothetical protein
LEKEVITVERQSKPTVERHYMEGYEESQ